jgi:hypothetical protein
VFGQELQREDVSLGLSEPWDRRTSALASGVDATTKGKLSSRATGILEEEPISETMVVSWSGALFFPLSNEVLGPESD